MAPVWLCARTGQSDRRVSIAKTKRHTLMMTAHTEQDEDGKEADAGARDRTPMVTALLRPRMLELRAAYSRQPSRRDRLAFLRQHAVVGGAEQRVHGDQMVVDRAPSLRRRRVRPERRPAGVMAVRPGDRLADDVAALRGVLAPGTDLLEPPPDDDPDDEATTTTMSTWSPDSVQRDGGGLTSRTLENWMGLTYSPTGSSGSPSSRGPRHPADRKER